MSDHRHHQRSLREPVREEDVVLDAFLCIGLNQVRPIGLLEEVVWQFDTAVGPTFGGRHQTPLGFVEVTQVHVVVQRNINRATDQFRSITGIRGRIDFNIQVQVCGPLQHRSFGDVERQRTGVWRQPHRHRETLFNTGLGHQGSCTFRVERDFPLGFPQRVIARESSEGEVRWV